MNSAENEPPSRTSSQLLFYDMFSREALAAELHDDYRLYAVVVEDAETVAAEILNRGDCKRANMIHNQDGDPIIIIECPNDYCLVLIEVKSSSRSGAQKEL